MPYPVWSYFPRNVRPPTWATDLVAVAASLEKQLDTTQPLDPVLSRKSDDVLARLRPGLESLGFQVETDKTKAGKINRPVLFGANGQAEVSYEIDAFHDDLGVAIEVEAGRGAANNADYRDIVRTSLLLDADYLVLFMPIEYHSKQRDKLTKIRAYQNTQRQLDAIYASRRLVLPFEGVLLIGY